MPPHATELDSASSPENAGGDQATPPPRRDWFSRVVIAVVVVTWAAGAIAQIAMPGIYAEPWWIHVIALCTVSYALTGDFLHAKVFPLVREAAPSLKS